MLSGLVETPPLKLGAERAEIWEHLKIVLAGEMAERIAFGRSLTDQGADPFCDDREAARRCILVGLRIPEEQLGEIGAKAMNEVIAELRASWRVVEEVAAALRRHGRLNGEEITAAMAVCRS